MKMLTVGLILATLTHGAFAMTNHERDVAISRTFRFLVDEPVASPKFAAAAGAFWGHLHQLYFLERKGDRLGVAAAHKVGSYAYLIGTQFVAEGDTKAQAERIVGHLSIMIDLGLRHPQITADTRQRALKMITRSLRLAPHVIKVLSVFNSDLRAAVDAGNQELTRAIRSGLLAKLKTGCDATLSL